MSNDYSAYQPEIVGKRMPLEFQQQDTREAVWKSRNELKVELIISHGRLSPEEIGKLLGAVPDTIHRRGDLVFPGYDITCDRTICSFKSRVHSSLVYRHVESLLDLLEGHTPSMRLWLREGANFSISVRHYSWHYLDVIVLPPETLARLARFQVGFDYLCRFERLLDGEE